jgi:hypothetical protein
MRTFHYSEQLAPFVLDDCELGVATMKLDFSLTTDITDQSTVDVCMSRIYSVIGNVFKGGIICTEGSDSAEMLASALSNFCVQLPNELNFEVLAELLYHKFHAVTDNHVKITSITVSPEAHNFGIEFNESSAKNFVTGYEKRWWFNPNLKFSDYDDAEINAELAWDEVDLAWPAPKPKKSKKPAPSKTEPVVIEFPGLK